MYNFVFVHFAGIYLSFYFSAFTCVFLCVLVPCVLQELSSNWIAWMGQREQPDRVCKRRRQISVSSGESVCSETSNRSSSASSVASGNTASLFSGPSVGEVERVSPVRELDFESCRGSDSGDTPVSSVMGDEENPDIPSGMESITSMIDSRLKSSFSDFFNGLASSGLLSESRSSVSVDSIDADMSREIGQLAAHKDGMDIAKFVDTLESNLAIMGCPRRRWKRVLLQKLHSESAIEALSTLNKEVATYDEIKERLYESLGSNLVALGVQYREEFSALPSSMTPSEKFQFLNRVASALDLLCKSREDVVMFLVCSAFRSSLTSSQREAMDQRSFASLRELSKFALSISPTRTSASFGKSSVSSSGAGRVSSPVVCFKCHKRGHRAFECRSSQVVGSSVSSEGTNSSSPGHLGVKSPGIVCYTCREPGHKSPDCPKRKQKPDGKGDGVKRKTYNASWVAVRDHPSHAFGSVNGTKCEIVPDTGAEISIVPGCLVWEDQLTGDTVEVRGWDSDPVTLRVAIVDFEFKGKCFKHRVAVAHRDSLAGRVLFSIPMEPSTAEHLLLGAAAQADQLLVAAGQLRDTRSTQPLSSDVACSGDGALEASSTSSAPVSTQEEVATVNVVTRSVSAKNKRRRRRRNARDVEIAEPVSLVCDEEFARLSAIDTSYVPPPPVSVGSSDSEPSDSGLLNGSDVDGDGAGVVGRAVSDGVEVVSPSISDVSPSVVSSDVVDSVIVPSVVLSDQVVPSEPVTSEVVSDGVVDVDDLKLAVPTLRGGTESVVEAQKSDDSLSSLFELGRKSLNGYSFKDDLLMHSVLFDEQLVERVVVPVVFRDRLLKLAHDKSAHVGVRGMRKLLGRKFTWPGMHSDICSFVKSCDVCLRINSSGNKRPLMVERRIVSVPFESVCVDLVGPLLKGKRGAKYLFTYVCLASRWPDAIPMRTASASEAAQCFIEVISRTGIPLRVLSDRGCIFLSKLMTDVCEMLGIDKLATSPYRPQSNGVVERMHGSLKPMLSKAVDAGVDWVDFLPLALFALRQVPNRDLGYSPHCIVYGRDVLGPLDVLYEGWVERPFDPVDVDEWLVSLNDRLAVISDSVVANQSVSSSKRAECLNKGVRDKPLEIGSQVLMRAPGIKASLQAAWEGPYTIVHKSSNVSYKVTKGDGHPERVAHRCNLKAYTPRPALHVNAVTVVAEDNGIDESLLVSKTSLDSDVCDGYRKCDLDSLLSDLSNHFSNSPGLSKVGSCEILLEDGASVVSLPPRQIPVGIREAVKAELDSLLAGGIIVESKSDWASPLVPVRKKDGGVRLCVDFRQLNAVTPLRRYWLPSLAEILDRVGPCSCLSTLDLTSGFHQIPMDVSSSELTTFVCPFGKYRYVRMPFGLKNAPAIFQSIVEKVLQPVSYCSKNYVDDVVVFSRSWEEHLSHLRAVIVCLGEAGFTIKIRKCSFGRKSLLYLGHKIGCGSLSVPEHRVEALRSFAQPVTKKQLRSFLGSMSYYRQFIPQFASYSSLLTPATSLKAPLRVIWTEDMTSAFCKLKFSLCDQCVLCIPIVSDSFVLFTDASGLGVGGCLHVKRDGTEYPVGFFSRQLRPAERNYSVTELETLAIVSALRHFEFYLYGREVVVVTDHQPCVSLVNGGRLNKRLLRFALCLQQFAVSIVYRPGRSHSNADGMSRQAWSVDDEDSAHVVSDLPRDKS